jgi:hypothetical protein
VTQPNIGLELTAYSVCSCLAPASSRSSGPAFGAKFRYHLTFPWEGGDIMTTMQMSPGQGGQPPNRAQLQDLIGRMRVTQLIYVAATLGIADQLTEGPKRIDELAATAAVDPTALYRVLRALASQGIFAETGGCSFALTPQAELLREDAPGSMRAWAMLQGEESRWKPWGALLECVRTGETAFNRVFGMGRRMVINGGRERSRDELRAFLDTAGFSLHRVIQTGTQDHIFEALPVEPLRS